MKEYRSLPAKIWFYIRLCALIVVLVFPFFWMVLCSFKNNVSLLQFKPDWFSGLTLDNYKNVLFETDFFNNLKNSLVISVFAVLISLALVLPASYSIARYKMSFFSTVIMVARMIPGISLLLPWFILFSRLRLIDTYFAVIISHLIITLPLVVWILISYFEDIPYEIEEAAYIDGCSKFGIFLKIVLPLVKTGIITVSILSFIFSWNHFLFALVLTTNKSVTLPVVIFQFMQFDEVDYGSLYAAASLITMPILLIIFFARNQFIGGLTAGSSKG